MPESTHNREPCPRRSLDWLRLSSLIVNLLRLFIEWKS